LAIRDTLVAGRYLAPVRGKVVDMSGKTVFFNITPSPVIACGAVPVSLIRPIPVPAVEDDVDIYRRRIVSIGSRNNEYIRRSRQEQGRGWRRDINPDVDVQGSKAAADHDEKKKAAAQDDKGLFAHMSLPF